MWWNTTFCPKHKLYVNAHTVCKDSFFLFFIYIFFFFFKGQFKKAENTGVLCALMFWSSCMSFSLRLQTSRGSDFWRQFVSGNGSFQQQLSVSWELLEEKRACSSFSQCWWIQHNEHVTDHKERDKIFFFSLGKVCCYMDEIEASQHSQVWCWRGFLYQIIHLLFLLDS